MLKYTYFQETHIFTHRDLVWPFSCSWSSLCTSLLILSEDVNIKMLLLQHYYIYLSSMIISTQKNRCIDPHPWQFISRSLPWLRRCSRWMLHERRRLIVEGWGWVLTEGGRALYISVLLMSCKHHTPTAASPSSQLSVFFIRRTAFEAVQNKIAFGTCFTRKYYLGIPVYFKKCHVFFTSAWR